MKIKLFLKNVGVIFFVNLLMGCVSPVTYSDEPPSPKTEEQDNHRLLVLTPQPFLSSQQEYMYKTLVADIARLRGNNLLAAQYFLEVATKVQDGQLAERATQAAWNAKQYQMAMEAARLWVRLTPNNPKARQILGQILLHQQHPEEAVIHLNKWLNDFQDEPQKQGEIIEALLEQQQEPAKALEFMAQLVAKQPTEPTRLFIYARLLLRENQVDKAQEVLQNLLNIVPDHAQAIPLYIYSLDQQNQHEQALQWLTQLLSRHPEQWDWRLMYARMLAETEQFEEAIKQFQLLLAQYPQHSDILYALGILSLQTDQISAAKGYFRELQKIGERTNTAAYHLGQIAQQAEQFDQALSWYQQVKPEGSNYLNAQARIARIFLEQGHFDKALEHLRKVPVDNEQDAITLLQLEAELLIEQKSYQQAMEVYNRALQLKTDHIEILYSRALLAEKVGRLDQLEQDLRRVLIIQPKNAEALNALGYSIADHADRSQKARLQEAFYLIKQALDLNPSNHYILDSMGWVLYKLGKYTEALAYLWKAQAKQDDPEIAAHLGEVLWENGDQQAARQIWKNALNEFPEDEKLQKVVRNFSPDLIKTIESKKDIKETHP